MGGVGGQQAPWCGSHRSARRTCFPEVDGPAVVRLAASCPQGARQQQQSDQKVAAAFGPDLVAPCCSRPPPRTHAPPQEWWGVGVAESKSTQKARQKMNESKNKNQ